MNHYAGDPRKPISIADNMWRCGGVTALTEVTIGGNTGVGAGAAVTKGVPANVVAAGNPARVIRTI